MALVVLMASNEAMGMEERDVSVRAMEEISKNLCSYTSYNKFLMMIDFSCIDEIANFCFIYGHL